MPRGPRKRSNSGIYHIMLRGTNKQRIFHDDRDYQTFLEGLRKYQSLSNFGLDTLTLLSLIPREELTDWHEHDDKASCFDLDEHPRQKRIPDEKALQVMQKASGAANSEDFARLSDERRAAPIRKMRKAGASLPQLVRITGISMALVRKTLDG